MSETTKIRKEVTQEEANKTILVLVSDQLEEYPAIQWESKIVEGCLRDSEMQRMRIFAANCC